jgi:predicted MarR family transcription regulator
MKPAFYQLLTVVAEPNARRKVSKANGLPSGAIPVLASIAFRAFDCETRSSQDIYGANMGAKTLIRGYIAMLVKAGLVSRNRYHRDAVTLQLTTEGDRVIAQYERELRDGCRSFGSISATRVLTA